MKAIYTLFIQCYGLILRTAALFNDKAGKWVSGRRNLFTALERWTTGIDREKSKVVWFHASSLGEFEQGRPVLEAFKTEWPEYRVLLTFFSPSGYEVRKNYDQADYVGYLPLDLPGNAKRFIGLVRPSMAVFIKYDYWFNMLSELRIQKIPTYYISAMFRPSHYFFRWYGSWPRKQLAGVTRFFVQNQESLQLLNQAGFSRVTLTGDTRFDRVYAIAQKQSSFPLIEKFKGTHPVFICGSTWPADEKVLFPWIRDVIREQQNNRTVAAGPGSEGTLKFIIAPHDTGESRIHEIVEGLGVPSIRYSELTGESCNAADILIIDTVGILSQLYRYAMVAFIGGGFGTGLHNIQEPITFGVPVLFGPGYHKFREATDLVRLGGAFTLSTTMELRLIVEKLTGDPLLYRRTSECCRNYVDENRGATGKIMNWFRQEI